MMAKVTFDGVNKIINVVNSETDLDVKEDIYSEWKIWVTTSDNAKFEQAMSAIGGDPITGTTALGTTYFLENGWRIQPWTGNYVLTISGNIFTREEGQNPALPASGVTVSLTRSNLVDQVTVSGSTGPTAAEIADAVWDETLAEHNTAGSAGNALGTASTGGVDTDALAAAVWNDVLAGHLTSGSTGAALDEIFSKVKLLFADQI